MKLLLVEPIKGELACCSIAHHELVWKSPFSGYFRPITSTGIFSQTVSVLRQAPG